MKRRGLGGDDVDHLARAANYVQKAWLDLERMPPTCEGGIRIASRAFSYAERAQAELSAVEDRQLRARHSETFRQANSASNAAWETINFYAGICRAPYNQTRKVPMFSRRRK
jgi:hypothetical protein